MLALVMIGLAHLVLLLLIWGALLELLEQQPAPEERAARTIQGLELATLHSMFQAARQAGSGYGPERS